MEVWVEEGEGLEEGEEGYRWGSVRTKKVSLSFLDGPVKFLFFSFLFLFLSLLLWMFACLCFCF